MTRKPETGGERQQATGVALPADLGRSLRLLDDDGLDRLMKAVIEEARRRGRGQPEGSPGERRRIESPVSGRSSGRKKETPGEAGSLTPGQERLILAAWEAGLKPAAIAREVRVSRPTVQHVITGAKRDRRRTDLPWKFNARASAAMTGAGTLPPGHRQRSRQHLAFGQPGTHRTRRRDETGRNMRKLRALLIRDLTKHRDFII